MKLRLLVSKNSFQIISTTQALQLSSLATIANYCL